MEAFSNTVKRKRRRTRKCLDEIRKRSRRNSQIVFSENYNNGSITKQNGLNNFITSKRLTLCMFPKSIRSETITRPALAELKQKPTLNLEDLVKGTNTDRTHFSNYNSEIEPISNDSISDIENHSTLEQPVSINHNKHDSYNQDKSSESFVLFSPLNTAEVVDKSPERVTASSSTPSTSQSLNSNYGYNLYQEFMTELPKYLMQNTSAHCEDDVMKKTKVFLQNLFIDSYNHEYENNVLKCVQSNSPKMSHPHEYENNVLKCVQSNSSKMSHLSKNMIMHNPMDYIRLGYVQHQSLFHNISSLCGHPGPPHSPTELPSPTMPDSDTPSSVVMHDTPEYTFYPHKLN